MFRLTVRYMPLSSLLSELATTELALYSIIRLYTRLHAWVKIRSTSKPTSIGLLRPYGLPELHAL